MWVHRRAMPNDAKSLALRWLSQRSLSVREVQERLERHGFDDDETERVVQSLRDLKLVDDSQLAEQVARQSLSRREGPMRIRARLLQRGIDPALGREVMAGMLDQVDWRQIAEPLAKRYHIDSKKGRDRFIRHLAREGFPAAVIHELAFSGDRGAGAEDDYLDN